MNDGDIKSVERDWTKLPSVLVWHINRTSWRHGSSKVNPKVGRGSGTGGRLGGTREKAGMELIMQEREQVRGVGLAPSCTGPQERPFSPRAQGFAGMSCLPPGHGPCELSTGGPRCSPVERREGSVRPLCCGGASWEAFDRTDEGQDEEQGMRARTRGQA